MASGWQQPAMQLQSTNKVECLHFGLLGAILTIGGHPEGHEWKCVCGQLFVVRLDNEGKKKLVKRLKTSA